MIAAVFFTAGLINGGRFHCIDSLYIIQLVERFFHYIGGSIAGSLGVVYVVKS